MSEDITSLIRLRIGEHDVHYAGGLVDGAKMLQLLDVVAGPHRCQELHLVIGNEQTLVAVAPDQQFGGDVTEEL